MRIRPSGLLGSVALGIWLAACSNGVPGAPGDRNDRGGPSLVFPDLTGPAVEGGSPSPDRSPCKPRTCVPGKNCGTVLDGCGGTLECGTCAEGYCGSNVANECGPNPCAPSSCKDLGKNCGQVSDKCQTVLDCGTCTPPETCGGGGTVNVCGCTPDDVKACQGKNCGDAINNCGQTISCGTCTPPATCGGGGTAGICGCTPTPCTTSTCGQSDGCGGTCGCCYKCTGKDFYYDTASCILDVQVKVQACPAGYQETAPDCRACWDCRVGNAYCTSLGCCGSWTTTGIVGGGCTCYGCSGFAYAFDRTTSCNLAKQWSHSGGPSPNPSPSCIWPSGANQSFCGYYKPDCSCWIIGCGGTCAL